jgi:hypothetical protein
MLEGCRRLLLAGEWMMKGSGKGRGRFMAAIRLLRAIRAILRLLPSSSSNSNNSLLLVPEEIPRAVEVTLEV